MKIAELEFGFNFLDWSWPRTWISTGYNIKHGAEITIRWVGAGPFYLWWIKK